jgi:hypothetical protein
MKRGPASVFIRITPPRHGTCAILPCQPNATPASAGAAVYIKNASGNVRSGPSHKKERDDQQQQVFACHEAFGSEHDNAFM